MDDRIGLTNPSERDACGTGFVAHLRGEKSHTILAQALEAVCNLEHRGAVSPDGRTSDGAGVQTQVPWKLIRRDVETPLDDDRLGLGMFFFPPDDVDRCRKLAERAATDTGFQVIGWREVPFDADVLGEDARRERPEPWQLVVARQPDTEPKEFGRLLFVMRRRFDHAAEDAGLGPVSVPSCSHTTVVYKGLVVPGLLRDLYPDLADPDYETAIALFHQRYSTNTMPSWRLAQPFRFLAHNGEINTVRGNVNRMRAREGILRGGPWGDEIEDTMPLVEPGGSDSAALDNVLEFLVHSGRDPVEAMAMLVPEAHEARPDRSDASSAWAEYRSAVMEPWDGPASLVFSDGAFAGAALDRNGLRPLRYWRTDERLVVGSEAGIVDVGDEPVREKGRLGPGQMLVLDTRTGLLCRDEDVKERLAARHDWVSWAREHVKRVGSVDEADVAEIFDDELVRIQKSYGYGREHLERVLAPMATDAKIPVGSMGDDTPLAVLSETPQRFFRYFKQSFAQVTNPAIDPLRERLVMSLSTRIGLGGHLLDEEPSTDLVEFDSPVVSAGHLAWLERETAATRVDTTFPIADGPDGLEAALERICAHAERQIAAGARIVILSDRDVSEERAPVPSLLATGAVHHHLIRKGLRMGAAIVCDAGDVIEDHDFACLLSFGAMLVHPWLAYESVAGIARKEDRDEASAVANYRQAIEKGLLKIMAKLGIADVNSYRGAQTFEALGVDYDVVDRYFAGCRSRIGGATLRDIAGDVFSFHANGWGEDDMLRELGIYRFRRHGEYHAFNPGVFKWLHKAVRKQDDEAYRKYAEAVDNRPPVTLRDLLEFRSESEPIPLDEVEPAEEIARRFCTQAMSFGSLSRETHELLAVAMNRIGGRSNSGEGGEEPVRFRPYETDAPERSVAGWHPQRGDWGNSAIKQVASGRFGVTPDYLVSATELEIKMAQGSKPGEGGHIPGFKVTEDIARTRRSQPGMTLISPPPHHDIYSIEDLAQLIYDLKRVNADATVAVKLVSVVGVGTIATGVAKGYADAIQISGHDGGTGASPLSSIKHAGLPWELGIGEVQQRLVENDLRGRVRLRVDGGLKTGRDVVVAAMLGGEEFGFGTTALVAAGCVMARQCHSNTCPVGIATQREDLRQRFKGKPDHVVSFMLFVAEHVRFILSELGVRTLDEVVGRVDLLQRKSELPPRAQRVDLSKLLWGPDQSGTRAKRHMGQRNDRPEDVPPLDQRLFEDAVEQWGEGGVRLEYAIRNADRSVGARLAGEIARRQADLSDGFFDLRFEGQAGQSFGVFCNSGMKLQLVGEAQDYVAKGMAGGEIVITPPEGTGQSEVIMGNTVAYGATGGTLFATGAAGERLAVRNSGATIVVEGCGDHGCEYMTGGTVVVLGKTGLNFAAGMSGGEAFVLDEDGRFASRLNTGMSECGSMSEADADRLRDLLERYEAATGSERAREILKHWDEWLGRFCFVRPFEQASAPRKSSTG
jgi:glutamate synthase domain-containing protein 2/glutamate synthase domain-containing protein 1/glutamate synthase domain-containing protein 3